MKWSVVGALGFDHRARRLLAPWENPLEPAFAETTWRSGKDLAWQVSGSTVVVPQK